MNRLNNLSGTHRVEHPFPALFDNESRILILGSFPSVKSREQSFFYGHPQNRFWKTLAGVLSEEVPLTIEEKEAFLHRNHIALWDVIKECDIAGSSDSSIKNVVPNDLSLILLKAPIRQVYCNGAKSYEYYRKYQEKETGMPAVRLPSTSPANAAWSLDKLIRKWREIEVPLGVVPAGIGRDLLSWYDYNARTLPWRSDPTPYHVWVSEIMLQQTRVETVISYYERWMEKLPAVDDLARISDEELLKLWEGLGYYNRAKNLKKAAICIMDQYGGTIPDRVDELKKLPGIGEYTAGAIASIAFGKPEPAIDGNVLRIYARLLCDDRPISKRAVKKAVFQEVRRSMAEERPGDFNQALMDLGAGVCIPNGTPHCDCCPWDTVCRAHKEGRETDYPVKAEKAPRRIEEKAVLVMEYKDQVILRKREASGLLAGLWEFPSLDGKYATGKIEGQLTDWGFSEYELAPLPEAKHIFSHVEWRMKGCLVRLKEWPGNLMKGGQWVLADKRSLEETYAVPSAFAVYKKIISRSLSEIEE